MKKIILIVALMTGLNSMAQNDILTIYNYTDCAFNFTLFLYPDGYDCDNDQVQSGTTFTILDNSTMVFDDGFRLNGPIPNYMYYGGITASYLETLGDARFVGFKTNDGSSISIGACGAASVDYSSCGVNS